MRQNNTFFPFLIVSQKQAFEGPQPDREELMSGWKDRWTQVRRKWNEHTKQYEEKKHGPNMAVLEVLYKK